LKNVINQNYVFMNTVAKRFIFPFFLVLLISCRSTGGSHDSVVSVKTSLGDIKLLLYNGTPVHKANFLKLVDMGFYDGVSFHRVIRNFMIQGGDPATKSGLTKEQLDTLGTYTIPAEFNPLYFHKKGALAAAREGNDVNPEMRSSGTQFYIVQGVKLSEDDLKAAELKINNNIKQALFTRLLSEVSDSARKAGTALQDDKLQELASVKMFDSLSNHGDFRLTDDQKNTYMTIGGVPRLDQTYTVFGEVIEGLDVVDKIAAVPTDQNDKPVSDVRIIKMKILSK
jgi:peptidylprolyl isomerase